MAEWLEAVSALLNCVGGTVSAEGVCTGGVSLMNLVAQIVVVVLGIELGYAAMRVMVKLLRAARSATR